MARIGLFCPPVSGHLHPMVTLGRALRNNGHVVTSFQLPEMRSRIEAEGLGFYPLGEPSPQTGRIANATLELGSRSGLSALRFTLDCGRRLASIGCEHGPAAVRSAGIDLLVVDDNEPAGGTVAEHLGLPFVNLGLIPLYHDAGVPPPYVPWQYSRGLFAETRNRSAYTVFNELIRPIHSVLNRYRKAWALPRIQQPQDTLSALAQMSQLVEELDFPRSVKAPWLHYLGPLSDRDRPKVPFPFERLDGRPVIYASLGTLQNQRPEYFRAIIEACSTIAAQLVLSTGGVDLQGLGSLPASVIAVRYAPQLEILKRAHLCITHGGLNTVMESLQAGVPLITVPITNDQPAVAARVRWTGAGEVVSLPQLLKGGLKNVVNHVLSNEKFRDEAKRLQAFALSSGGVERGARIVQQVLKTGKPVIDLLKAANA